MTVGIKRELQEPPILLVTLHLTPGEARTLRKVAGVMSAALLVQLGLEKDKPESPAATQEEAMGLIDGLYEKLSVIRA